MLITSILHNKKYEETPKQSKNVKAYALTDDKDDFVKSKTGGWDREKIENQEQKNPQTIRYYIRIVNYLLIFVRIF